MKLKYICCLPIFLFLSSCSSRRNLVYFSNLSSTTQSYTTVMQDTEPRILVNDILRISVNSTSPESNLLFASMPANIGPGGVYEKEGYRVNSNGFINFPVLGELKLKGLTLDDAQKVIEKQLVGILKNSIVNVSYQNFKVTVIGEVNHPSTFTVNDEHINMLEALGMAGDLTPYGKRENVLLIRETEGKRVMARVNLNDKDVINSPYFYLKQNDVIYIEPHKTKSVEYSHSNRLMPLIVASISAVAVLATTLLK
ncbi:polysaccharide biosynthesis/export family protein [Pedobacter sp. MC2016-24]|nr:polysaccharide biosynthesis/export family protein [Pedobacter sp. MC2016-24]